MIQSKLYRNIKIICGNDILVNNNVMYLVWMYIMRWMNEIADFGNNIVISCNKEAMSSEINSMKQRSTDIVNSIQLHKDIIKGCDEILMQLNPEIQERQRQEAENKALREEVNSLKEMFKEFMKSWQQ